MISYNAGTTQIPTTLTVINQTTQQNSDTHNANIVQRLRHKVLL